MLHEAPCSVLIARPARDPETWPQAIVAGVDGSAESELAVVAARSWRAMPGKPQRRVSDKRSGRSRRRPENRARARGAGRQRARRAHVRVGDCRSRGRRQPRAPRTEVARQRQRADRAPSEMLRPRRARRGTRLITASDDPDPTRGTPRSTVRSIGTRVHASGCRSGRPSVMWLWMRGSRTRPDRSRPAGTTSRVGLFMLSPQLPAAQSGLGSGQPQRASSRRCRGTPP